MKIFNGPKPGFFESARRSVLHRPVVEPVISQWDPSGELLETAGRHGAAFMLNRPLGKGEVVPWEQMAQMGSSSSPNMILVPDLETGLRLTASDIRLMDQDGVTIPAKKHEYATRRAALSNSSIWSVIAGSALMQHLDMAGLNFMKQTKNGTLDVAVSTSSPRLPRQGLLKQILTDNGFDEVLFGFERGDPLVLESSLGRYLLNLIGGFIQRIDRMDKDIIQLATVFDIFHPLAPMSSTDPTGGDGLFARGVGDRLAKLTNKPVRTTLTMINPLAEQPMQVDIRNAQLVPIEV